MTIDLKMWRSSNESCVNAIYDERDERTFVFPVCVCCKKKISHREEDELKYEGKRGLEYHISPRKRITRNALNGNPEKRRRLCNWSKRQKKKKGNANTTGRNRSSSLFFQHKRDTWRKNKAAVVLGQAQLLEAHSHAWSDARYDEAFAFTSPLDESRGNGERKVKLAEGFLQGYTAIHERVAMCPASLSPLCSTETSFTRCTISVTAEPTIRYLRETRKRPIDRKWPTRT